MGTYTKIKPAGLTKLNNAEYTNFMNAFYRLAFAAGGGGGDSESPDEISLDNNPLGITDAQKDGLREGAAPNDRPREPIPHQRRDRPVARLGQTTRRPRGLSHHLGVANEEKPHRGATHGGTDCLQYYQTLYRHL